MPASRRRARPPPASCSTAAAAGMFFLAEAAAAAVRGQVVLPGAGGATESGSVVGGRLRDLQPHRFTSPCHHSPRLPSANGALPRAATGCGRGEAQCGTCRSHRRALLCFPGGPLPTGRTLGHGYLTASQRSILRTAHSRKEAEITSGSFIITHLPPASHLFQSLQRVL